jgi:AraC-like DNA-binding protein
MPIILDHQLREQIPHKSTEFPVTYYHDELAELPNWAGPVHWHHDFEIATAVSNTVDYQMGRQHVTLQAGDSIFVNGNILHRIRQVSGDRPDPIPIILFSGNSIAHEHSTIYQKYIHPILQCDSLPFIIFRHENSSYSEINRLIQETYRRLSKQTQCYEMAVHRNISSILEYLFCNLDRFPKSEAARIQMRSQIRLQKMLTYIYEHYAETITLEDIANAAHISRSEAGRCFNAYMGCSPVDALIKYRLQTARRLLDEKTYTLQEISYACGFNSSNYFSRKFKETYGYAPSQVSGLGK